MSGATKVVHQDYIVKQRYHNDLPPPPGAPKLLKIPSDPMATYLSPFYTERMRNSEPINIEADAFLGMPIDLVGMPGVFEGDDSAILAPLTAPPVHPKDKLLLRPLKALGKAGSEPSDVSFLRRTQYVANEDRSGRGNAASGGLIGAMSKRRRVDISKEDTRHILRTTMKGFDIANQNTAPTETNGIKAFPPTQPELEAWDVPKHPTKPHLKLLDEYPLLPDMNAITNAPNGSFSIVGIRGQLTDVRDRHDERLDAAILRSSVDPLVIQDYQLRLRAHAQNPAVNPKPQPPVISLGLFVAEELQTAQNFKRKRDTYDDDRDAGELYTHQSQGDAEANDVFKLKHIRNYETSRQIENEDAYEEIGLAIHDPALDHDSSHGQLAKGAYFYPTTGRLQLKPKRVINAADEDEDHVHEMDIRIQDPSVDESERREDLKAGLEGRSIMRHTNGIDTNGGEEDAAGESE